MRGFFSLAVLMIGFTPSVGHADDLGHVTIKLGATTTTWASSGNFAVYFDGNQVTSQTWTNGTFTPKPATTTLLPGKRYRLSAGGAGIGVSRIYVGTPAGCDVIINDDAASDPHPVQRSCVLDHDRYIYIRGAREKAEAPAGTASAFANDGVYWSVSLGKLMSGEFAGRLSIVDDGMGSWAPLFTPAGLQYEAPSTEVRVKRDAAGAIQQIIAPEVTVDIVASGSSYELRFYSYRRSTRTQSGTGSSAQISASLSGFPFVTYRIEGNGTTGLKITSETRDISATAIVGNASDFSTVIGRTDSAAPIARRAVTTLTRSGSSVTTYQWTVEDWTTAGRPVVTKRTTTWGGAASARTSKLVIKDTDGTSNALWVQNTYKTYPWGEELVKTQSGEQTSVVTRSLDYYNDASDLSSYGLLKSTNTDGAWEAYDYWDATQSPNRLCQMYHKYRPFNSSPAQVSTDASTGEVTEYDYQYDSHGVSSRRATTTVTVNSTKVAKSSSNYGESGDNDTIDPSLDPDRTRWFTVQYTFVDPFADMPKSMRSATKYYSEYNENLYALYRNRPRSTVDATGVQHSYSYQLGTWNGGFTLDGSGRYLMAVDIMGSANPYGHGVKCNNYNGLYIDDVYLLEGQSTANVTIQDESSHVIRKTSYIWSDGQWLRFDDISSSYDMAGHLVRTFDEVGSMVLYSADYSGEQLTGTYTKGQDVDYTYDDAGRRYTMTRSGGVVTTYLYDGAGRVKQESIGAVGTTETIVTSRTYDDAGRIKSQTLPGLGTTNYSYDVAARTSTTELPADRSGGVRASRTEKRSIDGRLVSITGTASIPIYYSYAIDGGQLRVTTALDDSSAPTRWTKTWTDWASGTTIRSQRTGFASGEQAQQNSETVNSFVGNEGTYDSATYWSWSRPLVYKTTRTGYAPTVNVYDELGNLWRSGLDIDGDGLVVSSTDRITDTVQHYDSAWVTQETTTYTDSSQDMKVMAKFSTHDGSHLGDVTESKDADGNVTRTIKRYPSIPGDNVTITTTRTGINGSRVETYDTDGRLLNLKDYDDLVYKTEYDKLGRVWKKYDPRLANPITYTYWTGTNLIKSVEDQAQNPTTYGYDGLGRVSSTEDATGQTRYMSYNLRGQLIRQWGAAATPLEYAYNDYGERVAMRTFRDATAKFDGVSWPLTDGGTDNYNPDPSYWTYGDVTQWVYDGASGLLTSKQDANGSKVTFDYNIRGQRSKRISPRLRANSGLNATDALAVFITSYDYDSNTGELKTISYNDGASGHAETIPTHSIDYTYTRLGRIKTVADGTGTRTFSYDTAWGGASEVLPSFYGTRKIRPILDSIEDPSSYGGYALSHIDHRVLGFELLAGSNSNVSELAQKYAIADNGRFVGVATTTGGGGAEDFVYSYQPNSALVKGYSGASGALGATYEYDPERNLRTAVQMDWSSATVSRVSYGHDSIGRKKTLELSGNAYADYDDHPYSTDEDDYVPHSVRISRNYNYNARGELQSSVDYNRSVKNGGAVPDNELPGRRFEYRYDAIGNRTYAGPADPDTAAGNAGDKYHTPDSNSIDAHPIANGYDWKENNTVRVLGTADADATVGSPDAIVNKNGRSYAADVVPENDDGPTKGAVAVYAAKAEGAPSNRYLLSSATRGWFVAKRKQELKYDAEGNLTNDGVWDYTYDAENRLVRMQSALEVDNDFKRLRLDFKYDFLGRRVSKIVVDMDSNAQILERRYIYQGWNLIAETDTSGAIRRSYTWGLDLSGSLTASGGVGALLRITNYNSNGTTTDYYPAYDGNGNIILLMRADGSLAEVYEYSPFGEKLRAQNFDPAIADNSFGFSTKYTDLESGYVYYGMRYYVPDIGRFISRDSLEEAGGLNLYSICSNDVINNFDILGQSGGSNYLENLSIEATKQDVVLLAPFAIEESANHLTAAQEQANNDQQDYIDSANVLADIQGAVSNSFQPAGASIPGTIHEAQQTTARTHAGKLVDAMIRFLMKHPGSGLAFKMPNGDFVILTGQDGLEALFSLQYQITGSNLNDAYAEFLLNARDRAGLEDQAGPLLAGLGLGKVIGTFTGKLLGRIFGRATILANRAAGKAAEALAKADLEAQGYTVLGSNVTARTSQGIRFIDHLVDVNGDLFAVEVKSGGAFRSVSQLLKDTAMEFEGATLSGPNVPTALQGQVFKIPTVEMHYP